MVETEVSMRSILLVLLVGLCVGAASPAIADPPEGTSGSSVVEAEELPPELLEKAREGARLILQKKYEEAEKLLKEVQEKEPGYEQGLVNLAILYERTERLEEARKLLNELVDRPAKTARPYLQLSAFHQAQKEQEEAIKALDKGVKSLPGEASLWVQRAQLHSKGDLEKAEADYLKALEVEPENRTALNNLGVLYISRNAYGKARPLLERYVETVSKGASGRFNLAAVYYALGELDKGQALYAKLLEQRPGDAFATSQLALGHLLKTPPATAEALKVLEPSRGNDAAHLLYAFGMVELFKGDAKAALPLLSKARDTAKGQTYLEMAEAEALREVGRLDEAWSRLEAMGGDQTSVRSFLLTYQGLVRVSQGQAAEGRKLIQEGVALQPHYTQPSDLAHLMRLPPQAIKEVEGALAPAQASPPSTTGGKGGCGCAQTPPPPGGSAVAWLGLLLGAWVVVSRRR